MASQPQQRWLHDLIERIDAVVWEADPETFQFRYVSPSAERLLGFPTEDWLQPGFWVERLHPADRDRAVEECVAATQAGDDHRLEYRLVASDGSEVWVEDEVRLIRNPEDAPVALRGVLVNATSRRREEAVFRFLLENSSDVITIVDADGIIRYESPAIEPILGYARNELLGVNGFDLVHPEDLSRARDVLRGALRIHGFTEPVELRFKHRDGTWRWLESIGRNMVGGSVGAVIVTSRDITMQRRAGEAQKMEALGRLANTIAHDFNNILFVIKGHAELLRTGRAPSTSLQELIDAADRGAALTRQLLSFSRRQSTQEEACDAGLAVRELVSMLRPVIGDAIELSAHIGHGVPDVALGRGVFEQIVLNLLLNARDALPDGGRIAIAVDTAGSRVRLRVADTGTGMDDETRKRMFEPFFTTKVESAGTGLGLATVFSIVTQNGGDIEVETTLGGGTTFDIFLPLAANANATVLVADDDELVRRVVGEALTEAGYRVLFADSAEAATAIEEPIDIALLDAHLDQRRRSDLGAKLRLRDPRLRVVVMTGLPGPDDYEFADAVLAKPFAFDELRATLARVLNDR